MRKISLISLVIVTIIGVYWFWWQSKSPRPVNNTAPMAIILHEESYRATVVPMLTNLAQASELTADQLGPVVDDLAEVAVDGSLKDDHLLLFSSLDALRQYYQGSRAIDLRLLRQRIELFAEHREWARDPIARLVSLLPTS